MKKSLLLILAALGTVAGFASCSGGSDSSSNGYMTVDDFSKGRKSFVILNATKLQIYGVEEISGAQGSTETTYVEGAAIFGDAVTYTGTMTYTTDEDSYTDGLPRTGTLAITFNSSSALSDEEVLTALGTTADELVGKAVTISFNFTTYVATVTSSSAGTITLYYADGSTYASFSGWVEDYIDGDFYIIRN